MFRNKKKKDRTALYAIGGLVLIILFSALISNLTAPEETTPVATEFKSVTFAEYEELFGEGNEGLTFVYVGNPNCGYCQQIQPLLKQLEGEESIVFNYLNTDTMIQDDFNKISSTSKAFEGEWGTPTLLAIIDGKEHSNVAGFRELTDLRTFVKTAKSALTNE